MAQPSLDLIEAMRVICEAAQPITGRGVGYKLFVADLIESMSKNDMKRVYRLLLTAREQSIIPWRWIVDETRAIERVSTWADPAQYARCVAQSYRRDFWDQQPTRSVWSEGHRAECSTPYPGVTRSASIHAGFNSATSTYDVSQDDDGRPLIILVGDFDPSACSCRGGPPSPAKYEGHHITLKARCAQADAACRRSATKQDQ
jgi:hypothetical protein